MNFIGILTAIIANSPILMDGLKRHKRKELFMLSRSATASSSPVIESRSATASPSPVIESTSTTATSLFHSIETMEFEDLKPLKLNIFKHLNMNKFMEIKKLLEVANIHPDKI